MRSPGKLGVNYSTYIYNTVKPPYATTSCKRPSIKNTKTFPVEALQLESLVTTSSCKRPRPLSGAGDLMVFRCFEKNKGKQLTNRFHAAVIYVFRTLTPDEERYSNIERELIGVAVRHGEASQLCVWRTS